MEITSELIKRLRDKTGAGMMDCKRALESTGGNMDAAIEHLRKKGAAVAQKRADRAAKEGVIVTRVADNGKTGVMVEVNCETDFVARSEDFTGFASAVADAIAAAKPSTLEAVAGLKTASGKPVSALQNDLLSKVGEKIDVRRFELMQSAGGTISSYTHMGNKIGVLVELKGLPADPAGAGTGRDIAMQVAAMNPLVIRREQVEKTIVERELDIYRTQAKNEGKPAQIVDRIATGKLEKFYQEVCLMEQTFIKDSGKTIREYLQDIGKDVTVVGFQRFHLGEEVR